MSKKYTVKECIETVGAKKFGRGVVVEQGNMSIRISGMVDFLKQSMPVFFATPEVFVKL